MAQVSAQRAVVGRQRRMQKFHLQLGQASLLRVPQTIGVCFVAREAAWRIWQPSLRRAPLLRIGHPRRRSHHWIPHRRGELLAEELQASMILRRSTWPFLPEASSPCTKMDQCVRPFPRLLRFGMATPGRLRQDSEFLKKAGLELLVRLPLWELQPQMRLLWLDSARRPMCPG